MELKIDKLNSEIDKLLKSYSTEVKEDIKKVADNVTDRLVNDLKAVRKPYKTGKYANSWTKKEHYGGYLVHNKKYYMLTHLLEYGHANRKGGRTEGIKHIKPLEEKTIDEFIRGVEKVIK